VWLWSTPYLLLIQCTRHSSPTQTSIPKKKHVVVMAAAPPSLMPSTWLMASSDFAKISMNET